MTITLSELPYETNALEPTISAETLTFHYGKHHKGYVGKLNKMIVGTAYEALSLEDIIRRARGESAQGILNNAEQIWNHTFLWNSMSPDTTANPTGPLKDLIDSSFGDISAFKEQFKQAALSQFGSGWAWLVFDGKQLQILTTSNADSPFSTGVTPLLTLDVWEHAYYLDYQNERARYVDAFLEKLINWSFAAANLESAE